jgi:hypothetical protein
MRPWLGCFILGLLAVMLCRPMQTGPGGDLPFPPPKANRGPSKGPEPIELSPHETQERALQAMHEQNLEDTSRLARLSQELKWDLANHDREVLSLATVKKMDEIERLIKRIRARVGKM